MKESNLSKIKPKLRTQGRVSGNFGKNKVLVGSTLTDIGNGEVGSLPTKGEWLTQMLIIYPRMSLSWRCDMIPQLRQIAVTLNRLTELNLTIDSYSL
jgi:hypothetical protein